MNRERRSLLFWGVIIVALLLVLFFLIPRRLGGKAGTMSQGLRPRVVDTKGFQA
jgi:hypothetical protein